MVMGVAQVPVIFQLMVTVNLGARFLQKLSAQMIAHGADSRHHAKMHQM